MPAPVTSPSVNVNALLTGLGVTPQQQATAGNINDTSQKALTATTAQGSNPDAPFANSAAFVQNLATTNPELFRKAFGESNLPQLLGNPFINGHFDVINPNAKLDAAKTLADFDQKYSGLLGQGFAASPFASAANADAMTAINMELTTGQAATSGAGMGAYGTLLGYTAAAGDVIQNTPNLGTFYGTGNAGNPFGNSGAPASTTATAPVQTVPPSPPDNTSVNNLLTKFTGG